MHTIFTLIYLDILASINTPKLNKKTINPSFFQNRVFNHHDLSLLLILTTQHNTFTPVQGEPDSPM